MLAVDTKRGHWNEDHETMVELPFCGDGTIQNVRTIERQLVSKMKIITYLC